MVLRRPRTQLAIRGVDEAVELRRGRRLVVVNGDVRPQKLIDPRGTVVRLDRPGASCSVRFDEPGTYALTTESEPSLLPWLDLPRRVATIHVTVR